MTTDLDLAWASEEALLLPSTRQDRSALEELLAPEFREIGQSGRLWTRQELIDELLAESIAGSFEVTERAALEVGDELVLLTYRLQTQGRVSRRSSLWRVDADGPRVVFHQGTPN